MCIPDAWHLDPQVRHLHLAYSSKRARSAEEIRQKCIGEPRPIFALSINVNRRQLAQIHYIPRASDCSDRSRDLPSLGFSLSLSLQSVHRCSLYLGARVLYIGFLRNAHLLPRSDARRRSKDARARASEQSASARVHVCACYSPSPRRVCAARGVFVPVRDRSGEIAIAA